MRVGWGVREGKNRMAPEWQDAKLTKKAYFFQENTGNFLPFKSLQTPQTLCIDIAHQPILKPLNKTQIQCSC